MAKTPDFSNNPRRTPRSQRSSANLPSGTYKLPQNHGWKAKPGFKIFVAERGAVRFDYPQSWILKEDRESPVGTLKFHDRKPPRDDVVMQFTLLRGGLMGGQRLPSGLAQAATPGASFLENTPLPLDWLFRTMFLERGAGQYETVYQPMQRAPRDDFELLWARGEFLGPDEAKLDKPLRPALTHSALARKTGAQMLVMLSMDFWSDKADTFLPVWNEVLGSLQLDVPIRNPFSPDLR